MIKLEIAEKQVRTLKINGKENEIFADLFTAISLIYSNAPKKVQKVIKEAMKDDEFMDGILDGELKYKNDAELEEELAELEEELDKLKEIDKILDELLKLVESIKED